MPIDIPSNTSQACGSLDNHSSQALPPLIHAEIAVVDAQGMIVGADCAWWADHTDDTLAHALTGNFLRKIPDLDREVLNQGLRDLVAGRIQTFTHSYLSDEDRPSHWRQLRISPLQFGGAAHFAVVHEDLPPTPHSESADLLAEELLTAQENERGRIALELHDSMSQHLVVCSLGIDQLRRLGGNRTKSSAVLDDMTTSVQEMLKETRVVSHLMVSADLREDGLAAIAGRFVEGFGRRAGLAVKFLAQGQLDDLPGPISHAAFRVIQEALSNIHRHAEASTIEVDLIRTAGILSIRVADDGRGMPRGMNRDLQGASMGVGVTGMRRRLENLHGRLDISAPGRGTVVQAWIPLDPEASPPAGQAAPSAMRAQSSLSAVDLDEPPCRALTNLHARISTPGSPT